MRLNMVMYDNNGRTRGTVLMSMEFGKNRWSVEADNGRAWKAAGFSDEGPFEVKGSNLIGLLEQAPGRPKQSSLALFNVPTDEMSTGNAGTGRVVGAAAGDFQGAGIFWTFIEPELSPIRARMLKILKDNVPAAGLSSNDPKFKDLTGFDTASLHSTYWDVEGSPNRNFTTCNAFLGTMAGKLGAKTGSQLGTGPLVLIKADRDVPGSWVEPSSGASPRPGDYYSVPDGAQKFGHVGIIGKIERDGTWTSVDGGQGGRRAGVDFIKWVPRGKFDPSYFNGWIDIDKYFGAK